MSIPAGFPEKQPNLILCSMMHLTKAGKAISYVFSDYPYSPRWSPEELASRIRYYLCSLDGHIPPASSWGSNYPSSRNFAKMKPIRGHSDNKERQSTCTCGTTGELNKPTKQDHTHSFPGIGLRHLAPSVKGPAGAVHNPTLTSRMPLSLPWLLWLASQHSFRPKYRP